MSGAVLSGASAVTNRPCSGHFKSTGCIRGTAISVRPGCRFRPPDRAEPVLRQGNRSSGRLADCQLRSGETVYPEAATAALALALALPREPRGVVVIAKRPHTVVPVANHVCMTVMAIGGTIKETRQNSRARPLVSPAQQRRAGPRAFLPVPETLSMHAAKMLQARARGRVSGDRPPDSPRT